MRTAPPTSDLEISAARFTDPNARGIPQPRLRWPWVNAILHLIPSSKLPGANPLKDAHAALDTAVLTAYGFSAKRDLLAQLLALNQQVAAKIEQGEPVMPPGVPKNYPDAKKLLTEDCIKSHLMTA